MRRLFTILGWLAIMVVEGQSPKITSLLPDRGPVGTEVVLTGSHFNSTPGNNLVFFGSTKASVSTVSSNSLTVSVPAGATYAVVSVTNTANNLTGYSPACFVVTFPGGAGVINYSPKVDFSANLSPDYLAMDDLDGDGKTDIVVVSKGTTVSVLRNTSTPGSIQSNSFDENRDLFAAKSIKAVTIADLDGDGKKEILISHLFSDTITILQNATTAGAILPSSFSESTDILVGTSFNEIAIGDLDGDGKPDLVAGSAINATIVVYPNTSIAGSVSFGPKIVINCGDASGDIKIFDIDGDGKPELVVNRNSGEVAILRNNSVPGMITPASFEPPVYISKGGGGVSMAVGDLDGDRRADIVSTNTTNSTVSVLRNISSIGYLSFSSFVQIPTEQQPESIAIADMDGDGRPDIAFTERYFQTFAVMRNTSQQGSIQIGSFAPRVAFFTGILPTCLAIGDLDNDGAPDIAVSIPNSNALGVFHYKLTPLYVTWGSVNAMEHGNDIEVSWATYGEQNHDRFFVQRSQDGRSFSTIETIMVKRGESSGENNYLVIDPKPVPGIYYYRIKAIDRNGTEQTSIVVKIEKGVIGNSVNWMISPNPLVGSALQITWKEGEKAGWYQMLLRDQSGRSLLTQHIFHNGYPGTTSIHIPSGLPKGIYFVSLENNDGISSRKLFKN